ncbi:hypothetical protein QL285_007691 [Trifolium repens]|nr:hypothetical protein QL285_007691 [Trifolium repens]
MNSNNRNCSVTSYAFTVRFRGINELFCVELNDNLRSLFALKDKIQVMYQFKYARNIQIDKIGYYEPFIDLACDRVERLPWFLRTMTTMVSANRDM